MIKITFFIIHFSLLIFLFLSACSGKAEITTAELEKHIGPDELIDNLTMFSTIAEKTEWQMHAVLVKRYNAERRWVGYDVTLETLNEEDKNFYRSDSIYVNDIENTMTGMGNVEITSPNGFLQTEKIIWNRLNDQIHAPLDVYLRRDSHQIWGSDLYTNSNLDYVDMKNVRGHGRVEAININD